MTSLVPDRQHFGESDDGRDGLKVHTKEEAAAILRVKVSWLERRAAARQIPFTMLGGAYRFTDAHLAEIVRLNEQGVLTAIPSPKSTRRRRPRVATSARSDGFVPLRPRPKRVTERTA